jgi:hypothetical protein
MAVSDAVGSLFSNRLVQIKPSLVDDPLRLRRLICGKASPFRATGIRNNLIRAGWKAQPSSLCGQGRRAGIGRKAGGFPQGEAAERRGGTEWAANSDSFGLATRRAERRSAPRASGACPYMPDRRRRLRRNRGLKQEGQALCLPLCCAALCGRKGRSYNQKRNFRANWISRLLLEV